MIHYDGRLFRVVSNSASGDTGSETIFRYRQKDDLLTADYSGGTVKYGHLIGTVDARGRINMRYHHLTTHGILMTGKCKSRPEILGTGKIRLHERWQWTSGSLAKGRSTLEEI